MISGYITDKGMLREQNEDSLFADAERGIFMVADGVGGQNAGEVASGIACKVISGFLISTENEAASAEEIFALHDEAIFTANTEILSKSYESIIYRGMATTAVVATIRDNKVYISNVGDSRAYLVRRGELVQLTEDHTLAHKLVKDGRLTPEEIDILEKTNSMPGIFHTITRALGDEMGVVPDHFEEVLEECDGLLLCSDGLYGEVDEEEMGEIIKLANTPQEACENLVKTANNNGGKDNITAILIQNRKADNEQSNR